MKKFINHRTMRLLVGLLFAFFSSITVCAQKFGTHQVFLSDDGSASKTVSVKSNNPFSIKKDNRFTWVKYEVHDKSIKISASANKTQKVRNYSLILLDEAGNPVDTLEIVQAAKTLSTNANAVTKAAGASKSNAKTTTSSTKNKTTSTPKNSYGGQCAATTKKGTRCSRKATSGSIYCWQHNK